MVMEDDPTLWGKVAETIRPLNQKSKKPTLKERKTIIIDRPVLSKEGGDHKVKAQFFPFLEKGKLIDTNSTTAEKLKTGNVQIEDRLDLHGVTAARAKTLVENFIISCYQEQKRYLLIVTGRGAHGCGIIYSEIEHWLNQPNLRPYLVAFTPAHAKDGGEGALYVLIKKRHV